MLPEVEKFFETRSTTVAAYDDEVSKIRREYNTGNLSYVTYEAKRANLRERRNQAFADAKTEILRSDDKLVRYLINELFAEYPSFCTIVLEALPAGMAELNALAEQHGWCGEWEQLVAQARRADVLPAISPWEVQATELQSWIHEQFGLSRSTVRQLLVKFEEVVSAEVSRRTQVIAALEPQPRPEAFELIAE